jgi:hypothetical protein
VSLARRSSFAAVAALLLLLAYTGSRLHELRDFWDGGGATATPAADSREAANADVAAAFAEHRSGVWVVGEGTVEHLLADDRQGSRHQRFILRLEGGQTLLVSHNIDLAQRLPLAVGDRVAFRGEYEWNEKGGLVHWTHHDPAGRRAGGWLRHQGELYR